MRMPPSPSLSDYTPTKGDLRAVLKELRFITDRMKKKQDDDKTMADWKFASSVLDRLMLWILLLLTVVCTCVVLLTVPDMFENPETLS